MSINFGQETVTVNPRDYKLVEDMVSDFDETVVVECRVDGMNAGILRRSENLRDLDAKELNALIRFYDFFMYNNMDKIKSEVHRRIKLFLAGHRDLLDLEGVSHPVMDLFFEGTTWDIKGVSYHPLLELINPHVTFRGYSEDIVEKMNIYSLDLSYTDISDVSKLSGVHTLNLSHTGVTNVEDLGGVHTLNLSCTKVADVSKLGGVHTLNLSCTQIDDVSALGNVHTLNLSCTQIDDVSALCNVHTLDLSCTKVTNVSALGNVHTLDLRQTEVADFSALDNVHTLYLKYTDVNGYWALTDVTSLTL